MLEKELKKRTETLLENMDELFKYQIENICEAWSYKNTLSYTLFLHDYYKKKLKNSEINDDMKLE